MVSLLLLAALSMACVQLVITAGTVSKKARTLDAAVREALAAGRYQQESRENLVSFDRSQLPAELLARGFASGLCNVGTRRLTCMKPPVSPDTADRDRTDFLTLDNGRHWTFR